MMGRVVLRVSYVNRTYKEDGKVAKLTTKQLNTLQRSTFYGREKKSLAYVIAIMNLILHGIDTPNIIHAINPNCYRLVKHV